MDRETFSEKEAADTIRPIIDAINYCHSLGIIHRDIKVRLLFILSSPKTCSFRQKTQQLE